MRLSPVWVFNAYTRLASGDAVDELLTDYPGVAREDVLACIAYGAEMSRSGTVAGERDVA